MAITITPGMPVALPAKAQVHSKLDAFNFSVGDSERSSSAADGGYASPARMEVVAQSNQASPPALTDFLMHQVVRDQPKQALKDLSLNLATLLAEGATSVDQSVSQYRYTSMSMSDSKSEQSTPLDAASFETDERFSKNELRLSLKTKDGDTLTFTFRQESGYGHTDSQYGIGYQSLAVSFELDGELSEQEMRELTGLSEGLNALANDYFSGKGAKLSDLNLDDLSSVAELSLTLDGAGANDIKLSMSENDLTRTYSIQMHGDTIEMSRDRLNLIGSSDPERREAVLNHYRQMLIDGVERSHGASGQQALILDAFNLLHGEDSREDSTVELSEAETKLLTGLPDFSFSYEGRATASVFHPQLGQLVQQMSLSLSQETRIRTDGPLNRQVDQRQIWSLKSSYFEPLPHLDGVDFENQNYQYISLQEQGEVRTRVGLVDGVVQAVQTQQFESERNEIWIVEGEIAQWEKTKHSLHEIQDFTAQLRNKDDLFAADMLEEILIDPAEMAKRAEVTSQDKDMNALI